MNNLLARQRELIENSDLSIINTQQLQDIIFLDALEDESRSFEMFKPVELIVLANNEMIDPGIREWMKNIIKFHLAQYIEAKIGAYITDIIERN